MVFSIVTDALSQIDGMEAIALGGSRSRGSMAKDSDYDIGLYYESEKLDIIALEKAFRQLDDEGRDGLLHPPGAWGPWINGGGWLTISGESVDFLLRDLARVDAVLRDCIEGTVTIDYQCGHPFGFVNTIYAAETHYAMPLWENSGEPLNRLKARLTKHGPYPPQMRAAIVEKFMWEAGFSLDCARKPMLKNDTNYAMGSIFRTACAWAQVVYALHSEYLMNEKGALLAISNFERVPDDLNARIEAAYGMAARREGKKALDTLDALHSEMRKLTEPVKKGE